MTGKRGSFKLIIPVHDFIKECCVTDCISKCPRTIKTWRHRHDSVSRISPITRFKSYNSTHTCRLPNWTTRICSESSRYESSSKRSCGSRARTSRYTFVTVRIFCYSKRRIFPRRTHCKLIHITFSKTYNSNIFEFFCNRRFIWWYVIFKHFGSSRSFDSMFAKDIFYT